MTVKNAARLGLRASAAKLDPRAREWVDLKDIEFRQARQLLTVTGEKIVHDVRGTSCLRLELVTPQGAYFPDRVSNR